VLLSDECRHALEDGDEVLFDGVDGMEELLLGGPRAITVTGTNSFLIPDDARSYGAFGGGYCRELPRRRNTAFRPLASELQQPTLACAACDDAPPESALAQALLHDAFRALDAFEVRPM
jgi:hypothetical protein